MVFVRTVFFWAAFFSFTVFYTLLLLIVAFFYRLTSPERCSDEAHKIACKWGKALFTQTPGWSMSVSGRENLNPDSSKSDIFVSNHQSGVDICVLLALNIQFRFLSKAEIFRIPFMGQAMSLSGYIPIKRGDKESHQKALDQCAQLLKQNTPVLFFPEGFRSQTGVIQPFKRGAFRLGIENNANLQPIVIKGSMNCMRKRSFIPGKAKVRVHILKPIHPIENEDANTFSDRVRVKIAEAYDAL